MSLLDRVSNQFNYDADTVSALAQNYAGRVEQLDQFNRVNRANQFATLAQTGMFVGQQYQSGMAGLNNIYRNMKFLKDNNAFINNAKSANQLGARGGKLPEERMSDFSRRYYKDEDFRNNIESNLKEGLEEGTQASRASVADAQGLTQNELSLALNRGRDYVAYSKFYSSKNPTATELDVDTAVGKYAKQGEDLTEAMLNNARQGQTIMRGLGSQAREFFAARFRGEGQFRPLQDAREIARAGEVTNQPTSTPYDPDVSQDIQMNDMAEISAALDEELPALEPAAVATTASRPLSSTVSALTDVTDASADATAVSSVGTGATTASAAGTSSASVAPSATSATTAGTSAGTTAESAIPGSAELATSGASSAGEAVGAGLSAVGDIASSLLGPIGLLAGIGVGIYQLIQLANPPDMPPTPNPSRAVYDPQSL